MAHTFEPHPTGYTCTVCGEVAGSRPDTTHHWTPPDPVSTEPDTRSGPTTSPSNAVVTNSLDNLRTRLAQIAPPKRIETQKLRDEFDPTQRIPIDA